MPTAYRSLYIDWVNKTLVASEVGGEFIIPPFHKYEGVPLKVYLLEPDFTKSPGGYNSYGYSRVDISNLSLRVTVNTTLDDASPEAQQATWTKDTSQNTFSGEIDLNTAAMTAAVGSNSQITAYIKIESAESGGSWRTHYQGEVTVVNSVTQPTTTSPDPTQTYRTAAESDGIYMTPIGRPGLQLTLLSPSGLKALTIGVDDNGSIIQFVQDWP